MKDFLPSAGTLVAGGVLIVFAGLLYLAAWYTAWRVRKH